MSSPFAPLAGLLSGSGFPAPVVWLIASGSLVAHGAWRRVPTLRVRTGTIACLGIEQASIFFLGVLAVAVIIIQIPYAFGLVLSHGSWWYALGVTWLLATAEYTFVAELRAGIRAS